MRTRKSAAADTWAYANRTAPPRARPSAPTGVADAHSVGASPLINIPTGGSAAAAAAFRIIKLNARAPRRTRASFPPDGAGGGEFFRPPPPPARKRRAATSHGRRVRVRAPATVDARPQRSQTAALACTRTPPRTADRFGSRLRRPESTRPEAPSGPGVLRSSAGSRPARVGGHGKPTPGHAATWPRTRAADGRCARTAHGDHADAAAGPRRARREEQVL